MNAVVSDGMSGRAAGGLQLESSVDAIIRYLGVTIEEVGRKKLVL